MLDRRAAVRCAVVEAIAASGNRGYDKLLMRGVRDSDVLVAERAAKSLALSSEIVSMLREQTEDWHENEPLFRVWPFLNDKTRKQIVNEIFTKPNFRPSTAKPDNGPGTAGREPSSGSKSKPAQGAKGKNNLGVVTVWADSAPEYNRLFSALSLLRDVPVSEQRIPLGDIADSGYDALIAPALQVGLERRERFPVDLLVRLLSSQSAAVRRLAAANLAFSAGASDISRIEEAAGRLSSQPQPKSEAAGDAKAEPGYAGQSERLANDIRATVKKIRLRDQLAGATPAARGQAIRDGLADADISDWVWLQYGPEQAEGVQPQRDSRSDGASGKASLEADQPASKGASASQSARPDAGSTGVLSGPQLKPISIAGMGENIFPSRLSLYAAMANPEVTIKKLGNSLTGLQMDTARDQALFALMLSSLKAQLSRGLAGSANDSLSARTGIDLNAPIAAGRWTAEGAPQGLKAAQRKAVLMRVSDRERFERLLGQYQMHIGGFSSFTEGFSVVSRFIGLLPSVLPSAAAMMKSGPEPKKHPPAYKYEFRTTDTVLGNPVTIIERRQASSEGEVETDSIYLTYIGDEAVIAPDWISLHDALSNLTTGKTRLADNPEFKRSLAQGGDVIYLSDLTSAFGGAMSGTKQGNERTVIGEAGALSVTDSAWANSYRISIPDSSWLKPLLPFRPAEHSAASSLLPASTVLYLLMNLDVKSIWQALNLMGIDRGLLKNIRSAWAVDFEKEVLPEIGPECGAALLGVPDLGSKFSAPWVIFFNLKSGRLAEAMLQGRLIKNPVMNAGTQHLKLGSTDIAVKVKDGFLIFGSNEAALQRLDSPQKLSTARDFARAAGKAPSEVIAFGGYNLEAATAELKDDTGDYSSEAVIRVLKSLVRAFHSQNFYVTSDGRGVDAHMSVSLDREGRYSVAELASISKDFRPHYAVIEARGAPIADQQWLAGLKLKVGVKATGAIDRISEDLKSEYQTGAKAGDQELLVNVKPRRSEPVAQLKLPVTEQQFAQWLKPTRQIRSDDKDIIARAREIAGTDSDGWSVARKLADWTYKNLRWKVAEPGDAAHTLATREAACLEFSELYVAMARALGLPARVVTGMAYVDGSFGGHAWVEVYVDRWIEIDPTWGTNYVDATHLRQSTEDLTAYAALNLASIEVLEAPRLVPDFQRDPSLLVEKICEQLSEGAGSALRFALDNRSLTDEAMGAGTWASLNDREREQVSAAYNRLISTLSKSYSTEGDAEPGMRVLNVKPAGDRADALVMTQRRVGEALLRLKLERSGEAWILTDMLDIDSGFHILAENARPAVQRILAQRNGGHPEMSALSPLGRISALMAEDVKAALEVIDRELEKEPRSQTLRYLKAECLAALDREDEAVQLWTQLSQENPALAPALLDLAVHYSIGKDKDVKKSIQLCERYAAAVPDDPRPYESMGNLYEGEGDRARAESAFRAAVERDPRNPDRYLDLARALAIERHYSEAVVVLDEGDKRGAKDSEMFARLLADLDDSDHGDVAEELAAAEPTRMARSTQANLNLAYIRIGSDRPREALPLLKKAIELDPKSLDAYNEMALVYRNLKDWRGELAAADSAVKIDEEDSDAHYNRACALARLGRLNESLTALKRSLDLDKVGRLDPATEEDLKPLARLPGFKKLLADLQAKKDKDRKK
jgi:transglutaminase-like putative cysteine protease/Tfp pilus assembly protein PilF